MNLYEAQHLARDLMNRHGLADWHFRFDHAQVLKRLTHHASVRDADPIVRKRDRPALMLIPSPRPGSSPAAFS